MTENNFATEIKALLRDCHKIIIAGHINPDGDAVGACFALALCLKAAGKEPLILLESYAERFNFLQGRAFVYDGDYADITDADAFISVDTSAKDRLGRAEAVFDRTALTVCIDHHISNPGYAKHNFIDPLASSASEMMLDIAKTFAPVTKEIADCIYTGMIYDTGGFRNSATTARTHRKAAELIELGVPFTETFREVMELHSLSEAKIFGIALQNLRIDTDSPVAYAALSLADMREANATFNDLDGIVSYLLNLRGAEIAFLVTERAENVAKVSFRSKTADVNKIAGIFGGGGHIKASGATIHAPLATACAMVLDAVKKELNAWA